MVHSKIILLQDGCKSRMGIWIMRNIEADREVWLNPLGHLVGMHLLAKECFFVS